MYATAKSLLSSLLGHDVGGKPSSRKRTVKAATTRVHKERVQLIDSMCATWGTDLNTVRRYFQLSQGA